MAAPNTFDFAPHHPGMAELHRRVMNAFRVHWAKFPKTNPQKLVLTQQQADDLQLTRLYGSVSIAGYSPPKGTFNDRPVEVSDTTAGVLVAHDGTEMPLAEYDKMPTA